MESETISRTRRLGGDADAASPRARPRPRPTSGREGPPGLLRRGVVAFVVLGMAVRLVRYAQGLPFWSDECFLAVNFIGRGYLGLARPLDNGQVAPLLFLWVERTAVLALGFSEWSLRLFPLLCGLASLPLFAAVARRFLSGPALLAAVGIFAVAVHPIRHAADVKPYASDLLAALILLAPAAAWLDDRGPRRLWLLLALLPPAMAISNPAVFVAGGVLLGLAALAWKSGRAADRAALGCCGLALVGLFFAFHVGFGGSQSAAAMEGLRRYWATGFPPLDAPSRLPGWLAYSLTGSSFAYPGGGARGGSAATLLACLAGATILVRRGRGAAVVVLAAPLGLNLVAAALHRYPFGPEARLAQYAAPAICILAGAGAGAMLESVRRPNLRRGLIGAGTAGLVACAVIPQVASWRSPYRMTHDREARDFARSFWPALAVDAEVACTYLDYGLGRSSSWQGRRAWYLCNQAAYSPQRFRGGPRLDMVSDSHPLRCVAFDEDPDSPEVAGWLDRMRVAYRLRSVRSIPVRSTFGDVPRTLVETWRVYEFTPLPPRGAATGPLTGDVSG